MGRTDRDYNRRYYLAHKEEAHARYLANRDTRLARGKAWKRANPENVRQHSITYRSKHRDEINKRQRANSEYYREYSKKYRAINKEKLRLAHALYRLQNKDKFALWQQRYRDRRRGL